MDMFSGNLQKTSGQWKGVLSSHMHLLLVEDDSKMVNALKRGLEEENQHSYTSGRGGTCSYCSQPPPKPL